MNISQSIREILSRDEVVADLFYDIFLDRHPMESTRPAGS